MWMNAIYDWIEETKTGRKTCWQILWEVIKMLFRRKDKMYKFLRREEGRLFSAVIRKQAEVEYSVIKWAYPPKWLRKKGYGLFVFRNEESAMNFVGGTPFPNWELWECKVKNERELPLVCNIDNLEKGEFKEIANSTDFWPKGTVMADKVKLIRRIK